ncbi:tRNA 5-methoxyuridine(34)/uridine 5-oxyacetic acid(34) synthase CmoB [Chromohalobacter israelensis]|uniref:tRNA U34 carboxymethyltransferase n=1 Tax=Chromohalobacter israelensis (strain ATCC BAA-138 / DSM 3043 / CIP 106854 / NCIMB 13768 / 1H11) TaxID=290398 RepID=CMOB_CHRI1|nr:tRNA 5-methoxyuridine(34)/uridine 5-oxyacetic acid(34) synthase CmoB [Chromohalobacter salexigens]Q1QUG3.1 RecName: Full=tRNA U34 carboxymethyltransferase [Chromohalobacter salexigens DSM 3043]ABE59895.1 methyltransferase, putative [Chromohalobacter salexigens DSM 3043]MDO0947282.1 tRNA 5-methoxyuridine(34)/uridine 5-oxyacetic acid(34) synthase CmoB [Chromohalobacter salexigens]NWO57584.1 tRNA 5-methoxyuridine(34)/uridine 5-oxyacetic acid(34) synthase CmoB [Chromohalobacter salexigens]
MPDRSLPPAQRALFDALLDHGLSEWVARLPAQLADGLDRKRFGDLPAWEKAVAKLPTLPEARDVALDSDSVRVDLALTESQQRQCENLLRKLMPWRKGPYTLGGIHIDTEWRSDWKWQRVAPHLSPLEGRRVLDVGGGNGYHGWRMVGAGAAFVLIVDPSPRFYYQFQAVRHFVGDADGWRTHFLPVGIEAVPPKLEAFDTTFSMGVLYHRPSPLEHLMQLRDTLRPGGELVLETLVVEGDANTVFMPGERYAAMPNVYFLPSSKALAHWLERCGFEDVRVVDEAPTSLAEQRSTEWMTFHSLADFLDPEDATLTLEGYPAPRRAVLVARKPE